MTRSSPNGFGPSGARFRAVASEPILYLVFYLAAIPLFALVYTGLPPESFYAPYARYEESERQVEYQLSVAVSDAINSVYRPRAEQLDDLGGPEGTFNLAVSGPKIVDPDRVGFVLWTSVDGAFSPSPIFCDYNFFLAGRDRYPLDLVEGVANPELEISEFNSEPRNADKCPEASKVFDGLFDGRIISAEGAPQQKVAKISLPKWGLSSLSDVASSRRGYADSVTGRFGRMLYFSAITITSVGFGDIVPLTNVSRAYSAIEAVAGWAIAGLFLNAVASRPRRRAAASGRE